jgi:hypothetical protein
MSVRRGSAASSVPCIPSPFSAAFFPFFALNPPKTALFLSARNANLVRILQPDSKIKITRI